MAVAAGLVLLWGFLGICFPRSQASAWTLQTGLLDPLPLVYRSVSLVVLPIADALVGNQVTYSARYCSTAGLIGGLFLAILLANLWVPRFYCRFVCPLGALMGLASRLAYWRVGRTRANCSACRLCERNCEGACEVHTQVRSEECVVCLNCLDDCGENAIGLRSTVPPGTQQTATNISRRGVLVSAATGLALPPVLRLAGRTAGDAHAGLIRPPGSLDETEFLARCTKCGQCIRACPTNVLQPASLQAGLEGLWTPTLNNRIGSSGCQLNCVACSQVCPTGAIRPLSLDEKLGRGQFANRGPVRIGTAFVDRSRCLPWAADRPCIVCQELCPVSSKAIHVREQFAPVRIEPLVVSRVVGLRVELASPALPSGRYAGGDYFVVPDSAPTEMPAPVADNDEGRLTLARHADWADALAPGARLRLRARLQLPHVDIERCIGCGICENGCPIAGLRGIRVTCENESRDPRRALGIATPVPQSPVPQP